MFFHCLSEGDRARAKIEGIKIALHAHRVYEEMSVGNTYDKQTVRVGDQAVAGYTLEGPCTIPTDSIQSIEENQHFQIQGKANI